MGLTVMTFNYPYAEAGRSRPDPLDRLLAAHRQALDELGGTLPGEVILAGRSMGGRIGTYLAAEGLPVAGAVCYAYPLHPPGKPDKLRIEHLAQIRVPLLFFQGSRDALSRMDLFDQYVRPLPTATVIDLEANHSLGGLKNVPLLAEQTVRWISSL